MPYSGITSLPKDNTKIVWLILNFNAFYCHLVRNRQILSLLENEVDGEAFLLLTDEQIKTLVKAIGAQMKLIKKRNNLNASNHQVSHI